MFKNINIKSNFTKNVLTLLTGTTIAQAIPIAISPILTRIYTPEDFGVLSVFVSISLIFGSIAAGRYEMAIMLPVKDEDALNIAVLGGVLSAALSFFLLLVVMIFGNQLLMVLDIKELNVWIYFIPFVVLLIGIFNVLKFYNNRIEKYKDLSKANAYKSLATGIIQLVFGVVKSGAFGLLMGQFASYIVSNTKLGMNLISDLKSHEITTKKIKLLAVRYIDFPKFSLSAILANQLSYNLLNILISAFYSTTILGFYALVNKVLGMPTNLVGNAVGQVFYKEATKEKYETGKAIKVFKNTTKKLVVFSVIPFIILFFISEDLFAFVFGDEWRTAGTYAKIMIPMFYMRFITAPLSNINSVFEKQNLSFYWQLGLLIISIGTIISSYYLNIEFQTFLIIYSILGTLHYMILFTITNIVSKARLS